MHLPLYHRPNAIVFLDDDASYLEMLAIVMPRNWCVRLYTHIDGCIRQLQQEHAQWEDDVWAHRQIAQTWKAGAPLVPLVLRYWQTHPHRYQLTKVCIVDFSMPAMTGLDVLKLLPATPLQRVLLTGKADELIAVTAFNQGLITRFVPKQHPQIGQHLTNVLTELNAAPLDLHESIWRDALKKEQSEALLELAVQQDLSHFIARMGWVEYFVLAEPFGILGMNANAQPQWLQLEQTRDLPEAADLALSAGQPEEAVQKIRLGTHLTNAELLMSIRIDAPVALAATFKIGHGDALLGALFDLPGTAAQGVGYNAYMASLPPRAVTEMA
jgi:CheY-like chemotaxis protein